ncbi:hypothetical protein EBB79_13745 [Parasedimentitalea marina]|uniref:Uncharacterized protein n=1 Tax=Parasedimentitalea marina TaxID=2483033 RepID=A0A3T0N481_9RHOB|nr:hypothetical protein EBB79_13745 [Parasedimentitalea marina]
MSAADLDEIQYLVSLLEENLPLKIVELSNGERPFDGYDQKAFGDRCIRALKVEQTFGSVGGTKFPSSSAELLPVFELEQPDKDRIFKLCNDMRKIVFASSMFDEPHKKRLLNRIAAIEKQVFSKKGLFDVILGGVSDVGETLGKFGTDIKPLTDRMKEVARIARKGTKEYDQIPAPEEVKKLPAPDTENLEDD